MDWYQIAQTNIQHKNREHFVEMDVQRLIIEPLLLWLGYDIFDFSVVQEQTRISHSGQKAGQGRADYTIHHENKVLMIIEAKMLSESLDDGAKIKQLLDYCNYHSDRPRWGILTNGKQWNVYDNNATGNAPDRCILEIDIEDDSHLLQCLKIENLSRLIQYADTLKGLSSVPIETKKTVIPLLHTQFTEDIAQSKDSATVKQSAKSNARKKHTANLLLAKYGQLPETGSKPNKLFLNGKSIVVEHWSDILIHTGKYIVKHSTDSTIFKSWSPGKGKVRVSASASDLREPKPIGKKLFIEKNLSARDVIRTLNAMIDKANLSTDCYWVE